MANLMKRRLAYFLRIVDSVGYGHQEKRFFRVCPATLAKLVQFKLSDIGEGIAEVQIKEWFVKPGDNVKEFDNLCEVQSDKASVTITSRYTGKVKNLHHKIDEIARIGQPLVDIELEDSEDVSEKRSVQEEKEESDANGEFERGRITASEISTSFSGRDEEFHEKPLATPSVRRIARENNVNLKDIPSTGKDGRVLKEDILKFLEMKETKKDTTAVHGGYKATLPVQTVDKVVPIRGYNRSMAKTMAQTTKIPHFGYCDEVCVDRLVDLRDQLKNIAKDLGVKMSYMPLFIKAASLALKQFPILNSSLDETVENIIYKAAHNICIAVDTSNGLVVPNIKNCESKNLWEIASELNRLHELAKKNQIFKDDLAEGTFTLSNIGSIGGTYAHPVIFPPQVVIGALGRIHVIPRFDDNGQVRPTRIVRVSWSADHRIIDGATMARFCNLWKQYLENPAIMIAEMK